MTPAEGYAEHVKILQGGIDKLAALEKDHNAMTETEVAGVVDALTPFAEAIVERVRATEKCRASAAELAGHMTTWADALGLDEKHTVPASRVIRNGPEGAMYRAALRGPAAVVFELASLVASRAARGEVARA